MFIQTEETPNPNSLKFIPGVKISPGKPMSFNSLNDCKVSPLAKALFSLKYVESVFFGEDFITINKVANKKWDVIKPEVMLTMVEHFSSNLPIFNVKSKSKKSAKSQDSEIVQQIKEIIEHRVRPAVAQDGGDIIFHSFEDGVVKVELYGACSGCPSSTVTLKQGIENMLQYYVPEVKSVEAVNA